MALDSSAAAFDLASTAVRALMLYALAEFQAGHATTIRVTLDGACFSIADDGRGHPLDKVVEGTPYIDFIYTHFNYPFQAGRCAPIQLQGLGMSMVNALCSTLTLTVCKADEVLQLSFHDGQVVHRSRLPKASSQTGITVSATLRPQLHTAQASTQPLEDWLCAVLQTCPTLNLFFNGQPLQPRSQPGAQ